MISYAEALSRAKANRTDWNERERIAKAIITWVDSEYEYELEIENEGMDDTEFTDWVEKNAEELAKEDAAENSTTLDEVTRIDYETETIDERRGFGSYRFFVSPTMSFGVYYTMNCRVLLRFFC